MSQTAQNRKNVSESHVDRRVEKTKRALRIALHGLIAEKPYDAISVNEILARADVGRSTFYLHFRDKDELLGSTITEIVAPAGVAARPRPGKGFDHILWFSLPILEHHAQRRGAHDHRMSGRAKAILHQHLQDTICTMIVDSMSAFRAGAKSRAAPPDLLATFVASSFILVLDWWLDCRQRIDPQEADDVFRSLVVPTLTAASLKRSAK
jgi:AcrR family transcriptional regulator